MRSKKALSLFRSATRIVLLIYLGFLALVYFGQSSLVFQPDADRTNRASPAAIGLPFMPLKLGTADGESLDGWFVPATREGEGLVIFFHGNAGNIGDRLDYLRMFHDMGLATLMVDYRGYGLSSGSPSEQGTYLDAEAAWRHATHVRRFSPSRIVIFGESLGGAVAARLAATHPPGALVLASTFTSVPDLGADVYPLLPSRLLARIRYDSLAQLANVACPVLVIHSKNDDVIPFAHGRRLFDAARPPKQFLEIAGGHNEGFVFGRSDWTQQLDGFLRRALRDRDQAAQ